MGCNGLVATVVWQIDPREPRRGPTAYERRLHEYAQWRPGQNGPMYYWITARDALGRIPSALAAPLDAGLIESAPRFVTLLDGPQDAARVAVGLADPAARPDAPNAPPALCRAVLARVLTA